MTGWRDVDVLVTGGAGFVGANLVRALIRRGARAHCVTRPSTDMWRLKDIAAELEIHAHDLHELEALVKMVGAIRPRVVFHLAADGGHPATPEERLRAARSMLIGTANLLEAVREVPGASLVHAGSIWEYGPKDRAAREDDVLAPSLYRGALKAASTILVGQLALGEGRRAVTVRLPAVFGPWEQPDRLVPTVAICLIRDRELDLTAGNVTRDYTYVDDVVEGLLAAGDPTRRGAHRVDAGIINLGTGRQTSNHRVVELMEEIAGHTLRKRVGAYPTEPVDFALAAIDPARAQVALGWKARHSLRAGLETTLAWFEDHADLYP